MNKKTGILLILTTILASVSITVNSTVIGTEENHKKSVSDISPSAFPEYWWVETPQSYKSLPQGELFIPNWTFASSSSYTPFRSELKYQFWNGTDWSSWVLEKVNTSLVNNSRIDHGWNTTTLAAGVYNFTMFVTFVTYGVLLQNSVIIIVLNKTVVIGGNFANTQIYQNNEFIVNISLTYSGDIEFYYSFSTENIFDTVTLKDVVERYSLYFEILANVSSGYTAIISISFPDEIDPIIQQFLTLFYYNEVEGKWEALTGSNVNADWINNVVTVTLSHFSIYAFGIDYPDSGRNDDDEEENIADQMVVIPFGPYFLLFTGIGIILLVVLKKREL